MNDELTAAIVDVDDRQVTFRVTSVQPYHCNETTVIPRDDNGDGDSYQDNNGDEYTPDNDCPPPQKRRRLKGSKNKPKTVPTKTNNVHLTQREADNLVLSQKLRTTREITTLGKPFKLSTKAEIEALIARGVF
jgi:hypothetical protein